MTYVEENMNQMSRVCKPQRKFMSALFAAFLAFSGRATMTNLSRYGAGSERRLARWCRRPFDFIAWNMRMLTAAGILAHRLAAVIDASFLPKSGKHTWGLAKFHNGCHSRVELGLEACAVGMVDLEEHTAYTVSVEQTPAQTPQGQTRMDHYLGVLRRCASAMLLHTQLLLADGGFANFKFIHGVLKLGFHLVSKMRHDADLRYLYQGPRRPGRGRPKTYDGKVNLADLSRMDEMASSEAGIRMFTAVVNHRHFKRNVRVVVIRNESKGKCSHTILFSTDPTLSGAEIVRLYASRFQIEFLFRDGKQFLGFGEAQVRDEQGQGFFLNASLSALNQMRLEDRQMSSEGDRVVSIMSWKRQKYNEMLVERICLECGLDLQSIQSHPNYLHACQLGVRAA